MALFRRRSPAPPTPEPAKEERALLPGGLYGVPQSEFMGSSTAGVAVTPTTALENVAVWACQRVLVSTISMLPVDVIRTTGKTRSRVDPAPQVVRMPSGRVSRRGWVAQNVRSLVGSGNMYGKVVAVDSLGRGLQIETVHPGAVNWLDEGGEEVPYINGQRQTLWPLGDFWHVPASQFLVAGSRVAMSPTDFAKTSIGTGIAAERFGANFFRDGLNPTVVASVNADIDEAQAMAIKQSLLAMSRGNREPAVLGSDITLTPWTAGLKDSQFIELLQFEVSQACRVFGVPPSMVYAAISGQNITYANVAQADLQYLKYSVAGWLVDLEDAWSEMIAMPQSVKFNVDALLRMDALARAELAAKRLAAKSTTINAVKALEDEEPFDDPIYDLPGIPEPVQQALPL